MATGDPFLEIWIGSIGPYLVNEGDVYPDDGVTPVRPIRFKIVGTGEEWYPSVDHLTDALTLAWDLETLQNVEATPQDNELLQFDTASGDWVGMSLDDMDVPIRGGTLVSGNLVEADANENLVDAGVDESDLARRASGHTTGNLAELDADGDPADSGIDPDDVQVIPATFTAGDIVQFNWLGQAVDSNRHITEMVRHQGTMTANILQIGTAANKLNNCGIDYQDIFEYISDSSTAPGAAAGTVTLDIANAGRFVIPYISKT